MTVKKPTTSDGTQISNAADSRVLDSHGRRQTYIQACPANSLLRGNKRREMIMVNNVKPGYVNPLTMIRNDKSKQAKFLHSENFQTAEKKQKSLEAEKQSIQNSLLLMKGTSGDAGSSKETMERLEKKLEEITKEIRVSRHESDTFEMQSPEQSAGLYHTACDEEGRQIVQLEKKPEDCTPNVLTRTKSENR